nr:hypothetical protein CFP56_08602 [Quercus suber]
MEVQCFDVHMATSWKPLQSYSYNKEEINQDALRTFLLRKLDNLAKDDKCHITMISTWATELYLDKANKEEDDKMRTRSTNVAARAAVGGDDMLSKWELMAEQARQKREGGVDTSGSQPSKDSYSRGLTQIFSRFLLLFQNLRASDENISMEANKEEDDKMRTRSTNVAARAAVGGDDMLSKWELMAEQARQKREGGVDTSGSQPSKDVSRKPLSTMY